MPKPAFDPNKPFEEVKPAFDPDKPFEVVSEPRERRSLSPVESGLYGAAQGASFGFSDELTGAAKALFAPGKFKENYPKFRDENRAAIDAAKEDNPSSFMGGDLAGTVATSLIPGASFLLPAKGASTVANIGRAALGGAVTGAGLSNSSPTESFDSASNLASDVASGAALGAVTQGALKKVGDLISSIRPDALKKFAASKAAKAAGAMTKDFSNSKDNLESVGRELLDKKIVTAFASLDDVMKRSKDVKNKAGQEIGDILSKADDVVKTAEDVIENGYLPEANRILAKTHIADNYKVSMQNIANRIQSELVEPNTSNPFLKGEVSKLSKLAEDFASKSSKSLSEARNMKTAAGKLVKFNSDTVPEAFKKQAYGIIASEIENVVGKVANLEKTLIQNDPTIEASLQKAYPDLLTSFKKANEEYGAAEGVRKMAKSRLGATQSNRGVSLTDTIMAGAGIAGGGPVQGLALGALNKLGRKYGATLQAVGADKLADILAKSPNSLGRFGAMLEDAAKNGPIPLLAAHRALMSNPDYANIVENFEPQERGLRIPKRGGLTLPGKE